MKLNFSFTVHFYYFTVSNLNMCLWSLFFDLNLFWAPLIFSLLKLFEFFIESIWSEKYFFTLFYVTRATFLFFWYNFHFIVKRTKMARSRDLLNKMHTISSLFLASSSFRYRYAILPCNLYTTKRGEWIRRKVSNNNLKCEMHNNKHQFHSVWEVSSKMDERARSRNKGVVRKYIENKLHKRGKKCITQALLSLTPCGV